jgi:hypothetical protein
MLGGNYGNPGGGRPPSAIRLRCRGSFEERIPVLEQIADGEASEKIRVPLNAVLHLLTCPKCAGPLQPIEDVTRWVEVDGTVSPKARDRIEAIKNLAHVGLDAGRADAEDVRHRVAQTIATIRAVLEPEDAEKVIQAIEPVWSAS